MIELVLERFRLRARLRGEWLRQLWAGEAPGGGRHLVSHAEFDALVAARDDAEAEAGFRAAHAEAARLAELEAGLRRPSRLVELERLFALSADESDLLQATLALAVEPALGRACAYLHDDSERPFLTEVLVARLYGHGRRRALAGDGSLVRWKLVTSEPLGPAEPAALACDPLVRDWLLGARRLDASLIGVAGLLRPRPPLPRWPVAEVASWLGGVFQAPSDAPREARVRVLGPPGSGRRSFAAAVGAEVGLPVLVVDADRVDDAAWPEVCLRAQRQAFLDRCALAWTGETLARRGWPQAPAAVPLSFLIAEVPGAPPASGGIERVVELPALSVGERRALWLELVPAASGWPDEALDTLAARPRVSPADIAAVGQRGAVDPEEAAGVVREASRTGLGELARSLDCPFRWDDLVLPAPLLRSLGELVFEARERATFWEQAAARRLFPQGRGLFALFAGPPGTGKTMAAQVVAGVLGVDLFRISLAAIVSKWVGETSQNLARVLARAERMDAILLFDEADALFGKRTEIKDAHDRFANTDTNYLLQAIEAHPGIVLLATNKKANLDPAFSRRLRFVLDFPRPEASERLALWTKLVEEMAGRETRHALAPVLADLAQQVEATGAQIKFALLSASFLARQDGRPLDRAHLLRGLERELAKDGRALVERGGNLAHAR